MQTNLGIWKMPAELYNKYAWTTTFSSVRSDPGITSPQLRSEFMDFHHNSDTISWPFFFFFFVFSNFQTFFHFFVISVTLRRHTKRGTVLYFLEGVRNGRLKENQSSTLPPCPAQIQIPLTALGTAGTIHSLPCTETRMCFHICRNTTFLQH